MAVAQCRSVPESLAILQVSEEGWNGNLTNSGRPGQAQKSMDRIKAGAPTDGLHSGRHRSLLVKMPKPKTTKRNRVKGSASRGHGRRWRKWILILLGVLLLVPAMQVAVARFINPPLT